MLTSAEMWFRDKACHETPEEYVGRHIECIESTIKGSNAGTYKERLDKLKLAHMLMIGLFKEFGMVRESHS